MPVQSSKPASLIASFEPLVKPSAKILVLGSMPGQMSLDETQYYAHPRNVFWWIMSQLFAFDSQESYPNRVEYITAKGVAVWDVLAQCERQGSLDSNIKSASEVANPIIGFLSNYSSINAVFFNGQKAAQSFNKHIIAKLENSDVYQFNTLPSTSPANALLTKQQKLEQWQLILQTLGSK